MPNTTTTEMFAIPATKCVNRLKANLNKSGDAALKEFKEANKDYLKKLQDLQISRKGKDKAEVEKIDKQIAALKDGKTIIKDMAALKKNIIRVSDTGSIYMASVVDYILNTLVNYSVNLALKDAKSNKTPKVSLTKVETGELSGLDVYPLTKNLNALPIIFSGAPKKEESQKSPFGSSVEHLFKALNKVEGNKKVICSADAKQYLGDLMAEFLDAFSDMLDVAVRQLSKSSTIMDHHIRATTEILLKANGAPHKEILGEIDGIYNKHKKEKKAKAPPAEVAAPPTPKKAPPKKGAAKN